VAVVRPNHSEMKEKSAASSAYSCLTKSEKRVFNDEQIYSEKQKLIPK